MKLLQKIKKQNGRRQIYLLGIKVFSYNRKSNALPSVIDAKIWSKLSKKNREKTIKEWYFSHKGVRLNLDTPKTFNEKMQWMKLYDSSPFKSFLADKLAVRDWVKERIGDSYLVPLLGVWDKFDDIDFDKLPNQFVLKCSHGSGYNLIVTDKTTLDITNAKPKIDTWMNEDYAFKAGFELHYSPIPPKIIAEAYLNPTQSKYEIQVWQFNKKTKFVCVETIKDIDNLKRGVFYPNGERTEFEINPNYYKRLDKIPSQAIFDKSVKMAEKLNVDCLHCRIDFVEYNDDILFREVTFTSGSGLSPIEPEQYSIILGNWIKLPIDK